MVYSRMKSGRGGFPENFTVPRNYSGSAFFDDRVPYEPPREKESDMALMSSKDIEDTSDIGEETAPENAENESAALPQKSEKRAKEHILSNLGFEDLLIIGIILILSGSEADDDILLMLSLILAYKK